MIDFEPDEEARLLRDAARAFAEQTLAPRTRAFEAAGELPGDVLALAREIGLDLLGIPEPAGGAGAGLVARVLVEEALGAADAAAAFALPGPGALALAALELGTPEQALALLAPFAAAPAGEHLFGAVAWSEERPHPARPGFVTVAGREGNGYRLEGAKAFCLNAPFAERFVVFAQIDEARGWDGIGAFSVPREAPGLSIGERHATLGLDCARFGAITLGGVRVGEEDRLRGPGGSGGDDGGFVLGASRFFAKLSLLVAARAVGLSARALELARAHAETRIAFGKPIGHFQGVAFDLADRLMDVESSRWLVWRAAAAWDAGAPDAECLLASAQASAHALEAAMRSAADCVQLHGGSGFMRDLLAEKLMRDAKQMSLCAMTPEQCDQLAARLATAPRRAPLEASLVLPTPDAQAVFT